MRKSYRFLTAWLMACLFTVTAHSQTSVTISGTIKNETSKESVASATVLVKGTDKKTFTNSDGEFSITVAKLPVVLVISSAEFEGKEITVSDVSKPIDVTLVASNKMVEGVTVIGVNKMVPQNILEAPVTVERLGSKQLRNVPAPNYYEALANLKGVDVHTASLTFRTITTRGFVSSGNLRLNQLVDGMDNQAPGLNFSVGSVVGPSDLDVESVEVLSGASSALYGSGGMNGTVLINTKDPFKYQDLSYNIKQGIMHVDGKQRNAAPYYDWAFRFAKAFKNKLAFKVAFQLVKGSDWEAEDYRNKQQIGILSKVVGGNRQSDPGYNGINVYGDETSADMAGFSFFVQDQTRRSLLAASGNTIDVVSLLNAYYAAIGNPMYPTEAQRTGFYTFAGFPAPVLGFINNAAVKPAIDNMFPFYNGFKNDYYHKAVVSRTGYNEENLVDYNTLNVKGTAAVHYKVSDRLEFSVASYIGSGTTVYTGADRYSLRNLKIGQHKFEAKAKTWMFRAYTTQENAGEAYNASALGAFLNEYAKPSGTWFPQYIGTYAETRRLNGAAGNILSDASLHMTARTVADANRYIPGTRSFDSAAAIIKKTPIRRGGALFLDKSDLYSVEGQVNLSEAFHFSNVVEVIGGVAWKQWVMNSQGTIFADTASRLRVNEYGAYAQLKKSFLPEDRLTITASGRYDKQTNFGGRFTPRITGVIRTLKNQFLRLSYQSAYRFPSNQNQYISLVTGSGVLMGCLPEFMTYYKLFRNLPSADGVVYTSDGPLVGYTAASVLAYRGGNIADSNRLVPATFTKVKPEKVFSYEVGYKANIKERLLFDAYFYYSRYRDFLVNNAVVQSRQGNKYELFSPFSSTNLSYIQNSSAEIRSSGWGISLDYKFLKNYFLYGNVFSDELNNVPAGEVAFFNAPRYRYNIGLRNENIRNSGLGFNVVFKWQDNNYYEGTFVTGTLPYFGWWDAQLSYRPRGTKSVFRVGGTNLGNNYYRTGYGSPAVGGLYYASYGFNLQ